MAWRIARRAAHRLAALRRNTLALVFWLLVATVASGLVSLLASVLAPARPQPPLEPAGVYRASRVELEYPPLRLEAQDATLVPLAWGGRMAGVLVLAPQGSYAFAPAGPDARRLREDTGRTRIEDEFTAALLTLAQEEWKALQARVGAVPATDEGVRVQALQQAASFLQQQETEVQQLLAAPRPEGRAVLLAGRQFGRLRVTFAHRITLQFLDLDRRTLTYANPAAPTGPPSPLLPAPTRPLLGLAFASNLAILVLLVLVLTADVERSFPELHGPPATALELPLAVALVAAELAAVLAAETLHGAGLDLAWLHGLFAAMVLTRPAPPRFRFAGVGLTAHRWGRALAVGLIVGVLGHFAASPEWPRGLRVVPAAELVGMAVRAFLLTGLAVEVYRRGLVQTALQRRLGPRAGLMASALAFGLLYALPRAVQAPAAWSDWLVHGLLVLPATELVFGYMFYRTGSVWAGLVARAVLELLDRVLV